MKNKTKSNLIIAALLIVSFSTRVDAMSLYFEKPESAVNVGDTIIVHAYLDTEGVEINGIEGMVKVSGAATVTNLSVAGSVFSLWPNKPSLSGDEISFVGGSPSGVFGKKNKAFSIVLRATEVGKFNLSVKQADVFLNDGKGTRSALIGKSESIDILKADGNVSNQLGDLVLQDKTMPSSFKIELGKDASIFDGKYFISFYAEDNESGINRYEVRENGLPAVRSGNSYVLEDQSLGGTVEVKAVDNAGNFRIETIDLDTKKNNHMAFIIILVLMIAAKLYFIFKKK